MSLKRISRILSRCKALAPKDRGGVIRRAGYCLLCGGDSPLAWCRQCHRDMLINPPSCAICAMPINHQGLCGHCITTPPAYNSCLALYHYRYPSDRVIGKYKYQHFAELAGCFAYFFHKEKLSNHRDPPDLLLPVPLHWRRQCRRGFNQSVLFAEKLSSLLGIECHSQGISRVRPTKPQATLNARQRRANIARAFRLNDNYKGKRIALVDDVITTGATVNEISRLLQKQQIENLEIWVIARAEVARR